MKSKQKNYVYKRTIPHLIESLIPQKIQDATSLMKMLRFGWIPVHCTLLHYGTWSITPNYELPVGYFSSVLQVADN